MKSVYVKMTLLCALNHVDTTQFQESCKIIKINHASKKASELVTNVPIIYKIIIFVNHH